MHYEIELQMLNCPHKHIHKMAKVTQQDVVNFLKEKVAQLSKDLESAQNALSALEGSATAEAPVKRGRKPRAEGTTPVSTKRKTTSKTSGAKRGRKPKTTPAEAPAVQAAEQE